MSDDSFFSENYIVYLFGEVGEPDIRENYKTLQEAVRRCDKIKGASIYKETCEKVYSNKIK